MAAAVARSQRDADVVERNARPRLRTTRQNRPDRRNRSRRCRSRHQQDRTSAVLCTVGVGRGAADDDLASLRLPPWLLRLRASSGRVAANRAPEPSVPNARSVFLLLAQRHRETTNPGTCLTFSSLPCRAGTRCRRRSPRRRRANTGVVTRKHVTGRRRGRPGPPAVALATVAAAAR